jgi:hypothetical protein
MSKPKGTHYVVTANFTEDGAPAYWSEPGGWARRLDQATPWSDGARAEALVAETAAREQHLVCDPYLFMVRLTPGGIDPISARESIRSQGPTTRVRRPDPLETTATT